VKSSTAMLQKLSYVERYAWFAFPTSTDGTDGTGLYRPGNVPTLAGKAYRAAGK
jgi:Glycosyl hydrolase catalytic core